MIAGLFIVTCVFVAALFFLYTAKSQQILPVDIAIWGKRGAIVTWLTLCCIIVMFNCFQRIAPGEVGVVVNMFGSHKGVEDDELHVGYHFIKPWCTVYRFPIFEQNHQWSGDEGFNFQTSEGLSVHADIGITFNLEPSHIHELFAKYRRGMDEITHLFIRNNIRDAINKAASKMKIEELYGAGKEDFFTEIQKTVQSEIKPLGFNISHIYIIGQFKVPDSVMTALNLKIEATQRAQQRENELREAEAQARKTVAIAQAEAESNKLVRQSITPELLQLEAIKKWDGKMPQVMGSNKMPFILNLEKVA